MVLIYAQTITPRLTYIFKVMLELLNGLEIRFTESKKEFLEYSGFRISYGEEIVSALSYSAHSLLFDKGIKPYEPDKNSNDKIFSIDDPFAAAFYIISRYEEYLPFQKDRFGRFEADQSILYTKGLLQVPFVQILAERIANDLKKVYPEISFTKKSYSPKVLIDIDQAYSYLGKGKFWSTYILFKNIVRADFNSLRLQNRVRRGAEKDPYDGYDFLKKQQQKSGLDFLYFIHCGDRGKYDRTLPVIKPEIRSLIKQISSYAKTGIHPSFYSNEVNGLFEMEIKRLKEIIGKKISYSRQHYLRLEMPVSYHKLIDAGIKEDYSMGYSTEDGFRAGICVPYHWYDLANEKETNLMIYPVCFMEGIYGEVKELSAEEAWDRMEKMIDTVKKFNGKPVVAWHNHTVTDHGIWMGWKEVFSRMIKKLSVI
ncbi:MAG: polysaccharide deacetylase family protein [Flavitalea sp.]